MKVTIAGSEETGAFTYRLVRGFGKRLDSCTILISDPSGQKTQDYPFDTKGFKEAVVEDPTGTKIFAGRIRDIMTQDEFLVLECEGWLAQLNDVHIASYDTKEILKSGTTTREGVIGTVSGYSILDCTVGGANPSWTANQWANGNYAVVFPDKLGSGMRISQEYCKYLSGGTVNWIQNDHTRAHVKDWDDNWANWATYCIAAETQGIMFAWVTLTYQTAIAKASIDHIELYVKYGVSNGGGVAVKLQIYNWSSSQYDILATKSSDGIWDESYTSISTDYISTNGSILLQLFQGAHNYTKLAIDYARIDVKYTGTIAQDVFPITANTDNDITSSQSFEVAGVLGTDPFTICKRTTEHIKALTQAFDVQKTIDVSNVVATSSYKAREWMERTALEIIADLAEEDETDFWLDLTQKLYYNRTFGSPSKYVDDNDIIEKFTKATFGAIMRNESHIWGYKYPSPSTTEVHEVRINQDSKDNFGITRTQVERDTSIYTSIDAKNKGDAIASKNGFPMPQYTLVLAGKKNADGVTMDIGDYINVNLAKYGSENLLIVGKIYNPITDEMEYNVVKIGSAAHLYATTFADAVSDMASRIHRLMIQAGQRA